MMPYIRKVTMGAGVALMFALTEASARADDGYREHGLASYYGKGFHGRKAADGDRFSQHEMTAAHRRLPLGTKVLVENRATGEQAEVKITDRGPYADPKRRIIDLSKAAADSVGIVEQGVAPVRVIVTEEAATQKKSPEEPLVYEVQVGAFAQEDDAKAVLDQVQDWFPKAYMTPRQSPDGPYYRVRIGPFTDKPTAQRIARGLTRGGHRVFLDEVQQFPLLAYNPIRPDHQGMATAHRPPRTGFSRHVFSSEPLSALLAGRSLAC